MLVVFQHPRTPSCHEVTQIIKQWSTSFYSVDSDILKKLIDVSDGNTCDFLWATNCYLNLNHLSPVSAGLDCSFLYHIAHSWSPALSGGQQFNFTLDEPFVCVSSCVTSLLIVDGCRDLSFRHHSYTMNSHLPPSHTINQTSLCDLMSISSIMVLLIAMMLCVSSLSFAALTLQHLSIL